MYKFCPSTKGSVVRTEKRPVVDFPSLDALNKLMSPESPASNRIIVCYVIATSGRTDSYLTHLVRRSVRAKCVILTCETQRLDPTSGYGRTACHMSAVIHAHNDATGQLVTHITLDHETEDQTPYPLFASDLAILRA